MPVDRRRCPHPGRAPGVLAVLLAAALVAGCTGRTGGSGGSTPRGGTSSAASRSSRPGPSPSVRLTPTGSWRLTDPAAPDALAGFAGAVSVLPGQPVRLYVSTSAAWFRVTALRLGWYGSGRTAAVAWRSGRLPGHRQPATVVRGPTHTATAPWQPSLTVRTAGWPAGEYAFRLDASTGVQSFVPLTVRSASTAGRVVLLSAVTTWQAYNAWGGYSLYHGPDGAYASRAYAVSFDRPYGYGNGAADLVGNELPVVALAERLHLPLAYATDIDLQARPGLFTGARAVVSLGHDEYYSPTMRATLTAARDRGTNIAFLGANAVFRRIRLAPTRLGADRLEINYKVGTLDPLYGRDNPAVTANWPSPPAADPQSSLTGTFYECNPVRAPLVVADAGAWLFAGTGVHDGTGLPGLLGSEFDSVDLSEPTPRPIQVLFHSPVTCDGRLWHADAAYYTTPSGAGVFDSGTSAWVCGLDDSCPPGRGSRAAAAVLATVTTNLLRAFAAGPAGRTHPAQDNLRALGISGAS